MRKMLIADNSEINRSLLYDVFASQYELLFTESSEEVFRLLMENGSDISVLLINESIASRISDESARTLSVMDISRNIPIVLILDKDNEDILQQKYHIRFSDVISSPVNPFIAKKRVANLIELFRSRMEQENLINQQSKTILEQNLELQQQQKKINTINNDMLDTLSMVIEYRDVESGRHIHRIRKFTEALLRALVSKYPKYDLTEEKIELITSASSIHDIGKIAIPDSILLSPRRLTYDEFKVIKQHTVKGCEILDQLESVEKNEYFRYCYDICRYHHEKWDGQGYPDGLSGDQIPIWAQVVSLADCYDALTSERPYKAAYSHEQAVDMIRSGACGTFSDEMMDCFSSVLPKFKQLSIEYADVNNADRNIYDRTEVKTETAEKDDISKSVYLKMDRKDLIDTIENQKLMLDEGRKKDLNVLYKISEIVFEFDIAHDILHERKGSMKDICGYIPKNYGETINILSEVVSDDDKNDFIRTFRLSSVKEAVDDGEETIAMDCLLNIDNGYSVFHCTAVPVLENGKLSRLFFTIIRLRNPSVLGVSADRDTVTGLWNYSGVSKEINDYLENDGKNGYHALLLIDLDNFKEINRQSSYVIGNDILRDVADKLRLELAGGNVLGRLDDDNFLVFINDCPDAEQRNSLIEEIFKSVRLTYSLKDEDMPEISSSVGIALYPSDGKDFDELYNKAYRAVEIAKLNGKNMFLYYNNSMRENWELKKYNTTLKTLDETAIEPVSFEEYFIPVADALSGAVVSYDFIEVSSDYMLSVDTVFEDLGEERNVTALSINNISRLIGSIHELEKEKLNIPELSVYTMFDGKYADLVINAFEEILKNAPVNCGRICIMLTQSMIESLSAHELSDFVSSLKGFGFKVGVYNVGRDSIHMNCFIDKLFNKIVFASVFLRAAADGIYSFDFLSGLINSYERSGTVCILPGGTSSALIDILKLKTNCPFGVHMDELISVNELKLRMKSKPAEVKYPALGQGSSALVLNEKMYDEILEQTKSFIIEWSPRFDTIKISGSFESMYGYIPETDDFVRNISESKLIHPDDIKKLLEKMNDARSDENETEAFIRVYNQNTDSYFWNRVRFVILKNHSQVPVNIIAVFTDISDDREADMDESRRDRTDFITNLYNKHATENKIKSYLYDEGASQRHALMIVEICNFERLEESLGTVFSNAVLKETAQNIRELFRDSDIIGRNSGSRFTVFVKGMSSKEKITEKAEQICKIINNKYQCETGEIPIFGNVGVSLFPMDGHTYDDLYSGALRALYFAKHNIRQNVAFVADASNSTKLLHE